MTNIQAATHRLRPETLIAIEAVRLGQAIAQRGLGMAEIASKGERDIVTATDVAVEDAMRVALSQALRLPIVGEERGGLAPTDGSAHWLIDPICGTRNFASGSPIYCTNLALVENGQVTVAVVGDPSRGEINVAERGRGSWAIRDGQTRRLQVSNESRTIVIEDGKSHGARREHAADLIAAVIRCDRWNYRSLGSSLGLPYLAAGRIAAYAVAYITDVHMAAGTLIATEAGATITDIEGEAWSLSSDSLICAATPAIHEAILHLL